jgi:uroporphyrinogen decarboxylase
MTSRERVQAAFAHVQPDCTPCDYFGTPEIHRALLAHFGVTDDDALLDRLGTDLRIINPPYVGPPLPTFPDGSFADIWGVIRRPMPNEYGEYAESVVLPYATWTKLEQAKAFNWPSPDWYDYGAIPAICGKYPDKAIAVGSFGVQDFINGVAFGRGVEQVLIDIATEDPVYLYIVERRHRFYMEQIERSLKAAKGRIDMVLVGDDFGTQRGPLISGETFDHLFAPKKKELFDMVHSYGAKVSHHCCGSSRQLIPRFIGVGMDALQTIQPQAAGMSPYELKAAFAGRIVLHGGVDVQGGLQRSTPQQVEQEVHRLMDEVGKNGGFILGPCHNIQPDTPVENALAIYRAVAKRRGK